MHLTPPQNRQKGKTNTICANYNFSSKSLPDFWFMSGDCAPPQFTFSLTLVCLFVCSQLYSCANEHAHWFGFILQNKWCDNTEKRGTCGFSQNGGHIIFCKLKFSYFCSWLETHILFYPLVIGKKNNEKMIFRSEDEVSGSEICLLNQLFHTSERALWNTTVLLWAYQTQHSTPGDMNTKWRIPSLIHWTDNQNRIAEYQREKAVQRQSE